MRFAGLWRHGDFLRLWAAQSLSLFGSLIGLLALQFTAIEWLEASAFQVAILAGCQLVPGFLFSFVAGVWADRFPRRMLLITAQLARAGALVSIPIAAVLGLLHLWQLYAVAAVVSAGSVTFEVAYRAYLPSLVTRERLVEANSKLSVSESVAETGGFGISGWLVQLLSGPGAIMVNSIAYLWSAAWLGAIRSPEHPRAKEAASHGWGHELRDGMRFVATEPTLRSLAATNALLQMGMRMISVALLLYLVREVGYSAGMLGLIFAIGGLGSLAGAGVAGRFAGASRPGPVLAVAVLVAGLGTLPIPLTTSVSVAGVMLLASNQLITDPFWTIYNINELSLRQSLTPDHLLGRMNATVRVCEFAGMLLGTAVGGVLGEVTGPRVTLFVASGVIVLGAAWLLVSSARGRNARLVPGVSRPVDHG